MQIQFKRELPAANLWGSYTGESRRCLTHISEICAGIWYSRWYSAGCLYGEYYGYPASSWPLARSLCRSRYRHRCWSNGDWPGCSRAKPLWTVCVSPERYNEPWTRKSSIGKRICNRKIFLKLINHSSFILGLSRDAFDYIELYIFILSILCVAIAAPTFANEYQTGSDSIMRCTKNGRMKFAVTRILAAGCIFVVVFILGMVIHLSIINLAFGTECLKTSFQMLFSIINLPNINLGQLQVILVLAGLLSVLASISCTLFLSAKCRDSLSSLLFHLLLCSYRPLFTLR